MERPMEARLLRDEAVLAADVLKVGHHGSRTSTTASFLDAVGPSIAMISAGFQNSFGHPHRDVIGRLAERRTAVLRTDLDGLVTVRTDGKRLWFDTMRWRGGSPWWTGEHSFNWGFNWAMAGGWE
jgi:competence protein ComEC